MNLALVGKPAIDLNGLLVVANDIWGYSLAKAIDERQASRASSQCDDDMEKFLACLASLQAGSPQDIYPDHLLVFVKLSWFCVAESEDLDTALNHLPTTDRLVVPTRKRGFVAAWLANSLLDCCQTISAVRDTSKPALQTFVREMRSQLDAHGLSRITTNFTTAALPNKR